MIMIVMITASKIICIIWGVKTYVIQQYLDQYTSIQMVLLHNSISIWQDCTGNHKMVIQLLFINTNITKEIVVLVTTIYFTTILMMCRDFQLKPLINYFIRMNHRIPIKTCYLFHHKDKLLNSSDFCEKYCMISRFCVDVYVTWYDMIWQRFPWMAYKYRPLTLATLIYHQGWSL